MNQLQCISADDFRVDATKAGGAQVNGLRRLISHSVRDIFADVVVHSTVLPAVPPFQNMLDTVDLRNLQLIGGILHFEENLLLSYIDLGADPPGSGAEHREHRIDSG